jgi:hypothetical protein
MRAWGQEDVRPTDTGYDLSDAALEEVAGASFRRDETSEPITWGVMKAWAEANHVPDDALIMDALTTDLATELTFWPADSGNPAYFEIQLGAE